MSLERAEKICLFGGSFDPVHAGHLHLAKRAYEVAGLDKLLFLPAARSPFKRDQECFFSDEQRLDLLRCMTAHLPWAEVSEMDLRLPPPSWSWRVVELMREQAPLAELYWLMGVDQWEMLHRWARFDYLREQLTFIVHHRHKSPEPRDSTRAIFIDGEHPASSSHLRSCLKAKSAIPEGWLSGECLELIMSYE